MPRPVVSTGNVSTVRLAARWRRPTAHLVSGPIDLTYNYYANGNVYTIDDARTDKSATFHYDHLDRLASIEGFGAVTFDYDAQGNRTFKDYGTGAQITYTYDSATNRLTSATGSPGQP